MKKSGLIFAALGVLLSDIMCFVVAFNYRDMLCGIEHRGFSAPAEIAFLIAIPFIIAIILCFILAFLFYRKAKIGSTRVKTDILLKENIEAVSNKIGIEKPKKKLKVWEIVPLALGSPLWVSLLLAFFAVVLAIYISLWAVFLSFVACGFCGLILGLFFGLGNNWYIGFAMIAAALILIGLAIFFFFGCKAATKGFILLTKKMVSSFKKGEAK
jgi:MFS family permease